MRLASMQSIPEPHNEVGGSWQRELRGDLFLLAFVREECQDFCPFASKLAPPLMNISPWFCLLRIRTYHMIVSRHGGVVGGCLHMPVTYYSCVLIP